MTVKLTAPLRGPGATVLTCPRVNGLEGSWNVFMTLHAYPVLLRRVQSGRITLFFFFWLSPRGPSRPVSHTLTEWDTEPEPPIRHNVESTGNALIAAMRDGPLWALLFADGGLEGRRKYGFLKAWKFTHNTCPHGESRFLLFLPKILHNIAFKHKMRPFFLSFPSTQGQSVSSVFCVEAPWSPTQGCKYRDKMFKPVLQELFYFAFTEDRPTLILRKLKDYCMIIKAWSSSEPQEEISLPFFNS